jgi:hypothetical protein
MGASVCMGVCVCLYALSDGCCLCVLLLVSLWVSGCGGEAAAAGITGPFAAERSVRPRTRTSPRQLWRRTRRFKGCCPDLKAFSFDLLSPIVTVPTWLYEKAVPV